MLFVFFQPFRYGLPVLLHSYRSALSLIPQLAHKISKFTFAQIDLSCLFQQFLIVFSVRNVVRGTQVFQEVLVFSLADRAGGHSSLPSTVIKTVLVHRIVLSQVRRQHRYRVWFDKAAAPAMFVITL